ncbi:MAG: hypothetical protein AAF488_12000, partial [Planctomycetota bacterium]
VNRKIFRISADSPLEGSTQLFVGEAKAGKVTSVTPDGSVGLARIKRRFWGDEALEAEVDGTRQSIRATELDPPEA